MFDQLRCLEIGELSICVGLGAFLTVYNDVHLDLICSLELL